MSVVCSQAGRHVFAQPCDDVLNVAKNGFAAVRNVDSDQMEEIRLIAGGKKLRVGVHRGKKSPGSQRGGGHQDLDGVRLLNQIHLDNIRVRQVLHNRKEDVVELVVSVNPISRLCWRELRLKTQHRLVAVLT